MIKILVLEGYQRAVPNILESLHENNCFIGTVNYSILDPGYCSRYPNKRYLVKKDNLKNFLRNILLENYYDAILPILEFGTQLALECKKETNSSVKILCPAEDIFHKCSDKQLTMDICDKYNIPSPITKLSNQSLDDFLSGQQYPLIIKSRTGNKGDGFKILYSEDEVKSINNLDKYVLQQYIPHDLKQYSVYLYFDRNQVCKSSLVAEHIHQYPIEYGPGCLIKTIDNYKIVEPCIKLMSAIGWTGFCQVGLIQDPASQEYKVLEINGRIPSGIKICKLCGHDIISLMLSDLKCENVPSCGYNTTENIRLEFFTRDIKCTKTPLKNIAEFIKDKNLHEYIFSLKDPLPFVCHIVYQILERIGLK